MSTMFELTATLKQFLEFAESDDIDEEAFNDTLEAITGEVGQKADTYVYVIQSMDGKEKSIDSMIEALQAKKDQIKKAKDRMKERIKAAVEAVPPDEKGRQRINGDVYMFGIAKNGGKQNLDVDTLHVPDEYLKVVYQPDTAKIREALDSGKHLSFAHLEERGTHLTIR
ncbi:MAG: siphovirus Gp157 family protein [Lachnospiraceae bacterium]|nr:siphovirus Gp157 family protein [Lachnospiraceae bacterium]